MDARTTVDLSPARPIRIGLSLLFVVWLVLLVWLVLWKFHLPYIGDDDERAIKLMPFAAAGEFGASAPWEVLANLLLFAPLGVYLTLLAPTWRRSTIALLAAGASLGLEVAEYVIAVGRSDLTDVVVNTAGALVGSGLVAFARRRIGRLLPVVALSVLAALTLVAFTAIAVYIATFALIPPGTVVIR